MDLANGRSMESVNRVACLDAFLQSFSCGSGGSFNHNHTPAKNAPSPQPPTPPSAPGVDSGGSGNAGEEDARGGDLRAVTSGNGMAGSSPGRRAGVRDTAAAAAAATAAAQTQILKALEFLFCSDRALVESTIQVLDKSRVVKVVARSTGRSVWLVQGSRGAPYLCLREYCSCRSFQELVRRGGEHPILCKHLLAVRLAPALGVSVEEEVDDDKLAARISSCDYC
ncbi:unnamed protein product [Scytosiphon promiscuus]